MPTLAPPAKTLTPQHQADVDTMLTAIRAARVDPLFLAELLIVSEGDITSSHIIHRLIQEHIRACRESQIHCVILCPPEHGKSVQVAASQIHALGRNPGRNIAVSSADLDLSQKHLTRIRKFLLSSFCASIFPKLRPDVRRNQANHGEWSKNKLYLEKQSEPAIEAFALYGPSEGHRLDEVWLDDCVTRECQFSEAERRRSASAMKDTWLNRLKPGGIAIITNNVWHKEDAIHEMMASESYSTLRIQYDGPERLHFQVIHPPRTWRFRTEGTLPHWKQWPVERLLRKRGESLHGWKRSFEQKTLSPEDCRFPDRTQWATYADVRRGETGNPDGVIVGFLDISGGKRAAKLDWAVLVLLMAYHDGTADVLDCWVDRQSPQVQIQRVFEMHEKWSERGFKGIHALEIEMLAKDEDWGKSTIALEQEARRKSGRAWQLPWSIRNPVENKEARIERIGPPIVNGWLRFPADMQARITRGGEEGRSWERLASMLEEWPMGDHDDGPDAMSGAWDISRGVSYSARASVVNDRRDRELNQTLRKF